MSGGRLRDEPVLLAAAKPETTNMPLLTELKPSWDLLSTKMPLLTELVVANAIPLETAKEAFG